jgi:hypothetical protein
MFSKREASPGAAESFSQACALDRRTGPSQQHLKLICRKNPSDLKAFGALSMHAAAEEGSTTPQGRKP